MLNKKRLKAIAVISASIILSLAFFYIIKPLPISRVVGPTIYFADNITFPAIDLIANVPGDIVILANGTYQTTSCFGIVNRNGITYQSEYKGGAIFKCIIISNSTSYVTLDGLTVYNPFSNGKGIILEGDNNHIVNLIIKNHTTHGILFICNNPSQNPCNDKPSNNLIEYTEIYGVNNTGIKFESGDSNIIQYVHIHHNRMGLFEGGDSYNEIIRDSEFNNNGRIPSIGPVGHAIYVKGKSSMIQRNKVHHNLGFGIHCWASCYGTPEKPYIIEDNDVYENGQVSGNELVVGGKFEEAAPPNDGLPHNVVVRRNRLHHGKSYGLHYLGGCSVAHGTNISVYDNLIWDNVLGQIALIGFNKTELKINNNIIYANFNNPFLIFADRALMQQNALDYNLYYRANSTQDTNKTVLWNRRLYPFRSLQDTGVLQNIETCDAPYNQLSKMEINGRWGLYISNIAVYNITNVSAAINWTTNDIASSQIEYGLTSLYGLQSTLDSSMVFNHTLMISNISQDTLYHYRIKSIDLQGTLSVSPDYTFTTLRNPQISFNQGCIQDLSCSDFGPCIDGRQSRTCADRNNCIGTQIQISPCTLDYGDEASKPTSSVEPTSTIPEQQPIANVDIATYPIALVAGLALSALIMALFSSVLLNYLVPSYKEKKVLAYVLKKHVNLALKQGFSKEEIMKKAKEKGWPKSILNNMLK